MKTTNEINILFKDGTNLKSPGSTETFNGKEVDVMNEFKWIGFQISKQLKEVGKSLGDIKIINVEVRVK